jgi:glutamyl-tRNA reductase
MSLVVAGINHTTSNIALRERLAFAQDKIPEALSQLRQRLEDAGVVIVSTCNRMEIYVNHIGEATDLLREMRQFISQWHDMDESEFSDSLYEHEDAEAAGHLFRVAASLDSMIVGEDQILGQVHDAYILAHAEQATDKIINNLFQKAFTIAKKVRSTTKISEGKVSISSVAVDLAVSIFMNLTDKTVIVVGSGEMSELTLKCLVDKGVGCVIVANRSVQNAQILADQFYGEAISLDSLDDHLQRADIVISSTGAPGIVLHRDQIAQALKQRSNQPMFVIDIALPRDAEASINDLDNVYLYDIDNLKAVTGKNIEARRNELDRCYQIIDYGVEQFSRWLHSLIAEPTIVSLSHEFNAVRTRELTKTLDSLKHLSDADREEVEYLTKRIVNNILQQPMTQIKQEVHDADHSGVLQIVRRIFGLKESL